MDPTFQALDQLRTLPRGWDSYDADPVDPAAVQSAKECIAAVQRFLGSNYPVPAVGPTPDGGVALVWRRPRGAEVNALFSPGEAKYVVIEHDRLAGEGVIDNYLIFVREILKPRLTF